MSIEYIGELEREYSNAITNKNIGLCIGAAGGIGLVANILWGVDATPVLMGAILGGGIVFFGFCHDRANKIKNKLDEACYSKFGKSYDLSKRDIFEARYPPR